MIRKLYQGNRDAIHYFIVVLFQAALQIAILPIITALLSTEQYSEYSLANTIYGVLVIVAHFGILNAYSVLFYRDGFGWNLTSNAVAMYLLNSSILAVVLLGVYHLSGMELLDAGFIYLILAAAAIEVIFELYRTNLRLRFLSLRYLVAMVLKLVGYNSVFVYLMYLHELDGRAKFVGLVAVNLLLLGAAYYTNRNSINSSHLSKSLIKSIYRKASAVAPGQIAKSVQNSFDVFVVFYLVDKVEFALFAIAVQLSRPLERFSTSMLDSYIPQLYKNLTKTGHPSALDISNKFKYLGMVGSVGLAVILAGPLLFDLLVSNEALREAVIIFPFLIAGRFIYSLSQYHEQVIIFNEKYLFSSLVNVVNVLSMVVLFYLFTLLYGTIGIGYAYALVKLIHMICIVIGYRVYDISLSVKWDFLAILFLTGFVIVYHL